MDFDRPQELAAAGLAVLACVRELPFPAPPSAFLPTKWSELWTSRIELVRARPAIDAWFLEQLATLGGGPRYYVMHRGPPFYLVHTPGVPGEPWQHVDSGGEHGWLSRLWHVDWDPYVEVIASEDGARLLGICKMPGTEHIFAMAHATADACAMWAEDTRLCALLDAAPGVDPLAFPPAPDVVRTAELFAGEPMSTLPRTATAARRDAWLADCLQRYLAVAPPIALCWACKIGLAEGDWLIARDATLETPEAIAGLWTDARLAIYDIDFTRALALCTTPERYEARIVPLEQRTPWRRATKR